MDLHGSFSSWGLAKAKDFAGALIHPVLMIMNAVFSIDRDSMGVRLGHIVGGDSSRNLVNVHVCWHRIARSAGNLSRREPILNVDLGRTTQSLVNDAVSFGQAQQGRQLLFARIGVEIELQSYLLETDRHFLGHSQGAAEVEVAFGTYSCIPQPNSERGRNRV